MKDMRTATVREQTDDAWGKRKRSRQCLGAAAACVCLLLTLALIRGASKTGGAPDLDEGAIGGSELIIDSDVVGTDMDGAETARFINGAAPSTIDEATVYVNAGTMSGMTAKATKRGEPEELAGLISLVFDGGVEYTETRRGYDGTEYNFYITYTDSETAEAFTVFVFDTDTVKLNGAFFERPHPFDNAAFIDIVQALREARREA